LSSGWVFPSHVGKPHHNASVMRKAFVDVLKEMGLDRKFSSHGLRRTANDLLRRVATGEVTRAITGHMTREMTEHYSHVDAGEKKTAVESMLRLVHDAEASRQGADENRHIGRHMASETGTNENGHSSTSRSSFPHRLLSLAMPSRNAPCPCGSGQKYKKCCLARDEQRATERPTAPPPPRPAPAGCSYTPVLIAEIIESQGDDRRWRDLGLSPYAVAKVRQGEVGFDHRPLRRAVERHRRGWTTDKVRAMSTEGDPRAPRGARRRRGPRPSRTGGEGLFGVGGRRRVDRLRLVHGQRRRRAVRAARGVRTVAAPAARTGLGRDAR
ncbi:MAG: hypothetical protein EXR73_13135, partial [Myxococcales bacterium]|nr:hypothetical protein [Myxococcales bacterium]